MKPIKKRFDIFGLIADLVLFILGGFIILTQASFPTDWDSCQFVLGMDRFSPLDHQPHPPGYLFFIVIAQAVKFIFGPARFDNHSALLIVSALGGALLPPAVRRLTLRLYPGRHDLAIGAAILVIGAPVRLFFGAQALSYTWEGLFSVLLVSFALDVNSKSGRDNPFNWYKWIMLFAVAVGFRPNLVLFFIPLAVFLSLRRKWINIIIGLVLFSMVTIAWLIPSAAASDGILRYIQSVQGHSAYFLELGLGFDRLNHNFSELLSTPEALTGINLIFWIISVVISVVISRKINERVLPSDKHSNLVILLTVLPLVVFHLFFFYTLRYSLLYLPILIPIFSRSLSLPIEWLVKQLTKNQNSSKQGSIKFVVILIPLLIMLISYVAFFTGGGKHSLEQIRSLERQTRIVVETIESLGNEGPVTVIAGRKFRPWGTALPSFTIYHPMKSLYPSELNPRLTAMRDGDTFLGDFYLPGSTDSGPIQLPLQTNSTEQYIVLDQDSHNALIESTDVWEAVRITSQKNFYIGRFTSDLVFDDSADGIRIYADE